MARILKEDYHITSPVLPLHDRPPTHFQPLDGAQQASFLSQLPETSAFSDALTSGKTYLLVSSTSWTADEDFSLLLNALVEYSQIASRRQVPHLLMLITGKGPQKQFYLNKIAQLEDSGQLSQITIKTAWLSNAEYASLLGSASLGISLHTSSSGVDLPMKVVDMFGAGLPVIGWSDFEAWPELVQEGVNGMGFKNQTQLVELLEMLFGGGGSELKDLKSGALKEGQRRWDDEWNPIAGKLLGLCA
jgi:beta-1,4-mannosyltransferase